MGRSRGRGFCRCRRGSAVEGRLAQHAALDREPFTWDEADWAVLEDKIRSISRAGWWIDQRDTDGADLPELLDAATSADIGTENPHR
ncbi:hypothetical protein [Streptomyces yangpuensis]|uniref:hypothetical protein n=1 Tax=Streptomyces yangpuensis TaxID=1648182 RepID=UPI0036A08C7F